MTRTSIILLVNCRRGREGRREGGREGGREGEREGRVKRTIDTSFLKRPRDKALVYLLSV